MEEQLVTLGAPRDKIVYCPCGVDVSSFSGADPASAPPTFLAVGRFVDKKAPHLTLLAFRKVVDAFPEARLIMAGTGALHQACTQLAAGLRLSEYVSFLGAIPHREVAALMQRVRGFVQHSIRPEDGDSEGTPVAVVEAGAAGLPVVATAHGGIRDVIVHGETGFLVREGDIDTMADYMILLAADAALAAKLGRQARTRVAAHFSLETSIARLWSVLDQAISQPSVVVRQAQSVLAQHNGAPEVP
jgi:glycosyltransferase involved in cell wall biosynthesis